MVEFDADAWIILLAIRVKCPKFPILVFALVIVGFGCTGTCIQFIAAYNYAVQIMHTTEEGAITIQTLKEIE